MYIRRGIRAASIFRIRVWINADVCLPYCNFLVAWSRILGGWVFGLMLPVRPIVANPHDNARINIIVSYAGNYNRGDPRQT